MFVCDKCGLCCMSVGDSEIYAELNRGDGVCRFLDTKTRLCIIYNKRPVLCNVDKTYELFFKSKMTLSEYYKLNYESCKKMKTEKL